VPRSPSLGRGMPWAGRFSACRECRFGKQQQPLGRIQTALAPSSQAVAPASRRMVGGPWGLKRISRAIALVGDTPWVASMLACRGG